MFYVVINGETVQLKSQNLEDAMSEIAATVNTPEPVQVFTAEKDVKPVKEKFNPEHYDLGGEG